MVDRLGVRRLFQFGIVPLVAILAALALLFSSWIYTYHRLSHEALIAELTFEPVGAGVYRASVATGDLCSVRHFEIDGDQWRIEAQFLKWKSWANLLGLDALYRLDRIEGRYRDIVRQNTRPPVAHALPRETFVDTVGLAGSLGRLNLFMDATYGSSTYHDIDTHAVYRVYRTQSGLITRIAPRPRPVAATAGPLSIEIDRACGDDGGTWHLFAAWLDDRLLAYVRG